MVHFQQQSHAQSEYMNFPCDARSSPAAAVSYGRFLAQDALLIDIPRRRNQSAAVRGPWDKTKLPESDIFCGSSRIDKKKKSALKYCSVFVNAHVGVSVCGRAKERARRGASSAAAAEQQLAAAAAERCHSAHYFKSREYDFTRLGTAL